MTSAEAAFAKPSEAATAKVAPLPAIRYMSASWQSTRSSVG
jgi:hypothetical protein